MTQHSDTKNRYRIVTKLCSGGMADIFLGIQLDQQVLERLVVIKKIHSVADNSPDSRGMFADEARIISTLNHPHVVQIFDFTEENDSFHIIMEYIDGENLGYILNVLRKKNERIPLKIGLKLMDQALEAIQYIHTATSLSGKPLDIVHRDLDPRNLMIDSNGYVKVIDFGVAKAVVQTELTAPGLFKGKLSHVAPEIFTRSDIDHRADIYSLGLVLFEIATGEKPYRFGKGAILAETIKRIVDDPLPAPRDLNPEIPEKLEEIIRKACDKDREKRYQTADELHVALSEFAHDSSVGAGMATSTEVKKWFNEQFADRLKKRRSYENMTLQKARIALEGMRSMRHTGMIQTGVDNDRHGFSTLVSGVYPSDGRLTGTESISGMSAFGTGQIPNPSFPPSSSANMRLPTTNPPGMGPNPFGTTTGVPSLEPFGSDDRSDTFTGATRKHLIRIGLGAAAVALITTVVAFLFWRSDISMDKQAGKNNTVAVDGTVTAVDPIGITTHSPKKADLAGNHAEEGTAGVDEEKAASEIEDTGDDVAMTPAANSQTARAHITGRSWSNQRGKHRRQAVREMELTDDVEAYNTDDEEREGTSLDIESRTVAMVDNADKSFSRIYEPAAVQVDTNKYEPVSPKVMGTSSTPDKQKPEPQAAPSMPSAPKYISVGGNWNGARVASEGCGSCHPVKATSKTPNQWKYFFSHDRHRRNANLRALFSPSELRRVETHLISIVESSKKNNSGIAGIR
ncbi:MAG: serine/threonine protein kinase [Deltaproteobacteria bacterium]|nr:serine/threonine protein kinase [Deltaproteobacteria bacterium]